MSPYGTIARPASDKSLSSYLPRHATLRSSDNATLFHITIAESISPEDSKFTLSGRAHPALVEAMRKVFNDEVLRGDTYPHETVVDMQGFESYFFGGDAFVLLRGDYTSAELVPTTRTSIEEWDHDLLGFFYIKPNFPGRCSHVRLVFAKRFANPKHTLCHFNWLCIHRYLVSTLISRSATVDSWCTQCIVDWASGRSLERRS